MVICPAGSIFHCLSHFEMIDESSMQLLHAEGYNDTQINAQLSMLGSKFFSSFARSPMEAILKVCPDINDMRFQPDSDGKVRLSFKYGQNIGTSNIIRIDALSREELSSFRTEERNGLLVNKVKTDKIVLTDECQLGLSANNGNYSVVTIYPGEMAPPLPGYGEKNPFWNTHCFIE